MACVFVITGPSGVGKGTLIRGLMERVPRLELSVSATTRAPRAGEHDGVDYHFLTGEEFERRVRRKTLSSTPTTPGAATGRSARSWRTGCARARPWCSRSRCRAPGRCARRCPRLSRCSSRRPRSTTRCARLIGRGTDDAEEVERRLRVAEQELRRATRVRPRRGQRPPRGRARGADGGRRRRARLTRRDRLTRHTEKTVSGGRTRAHYT